jgi:hypothetical protein
MEHLLLVFLEEGLTLRRKNSFFGLQEMEYLGYTVSGGKLSVPTKKVARGSQGVAGAEDSA